ncbi:MAG: bifunctional DNA-formamidopyrimidine glycosylase/DNA-(apurinic or apyrimidinic site) lyase [Planctomycetota bacterium]
MPELPEVETVARLIRPKLVGRTVEGARVTWAPTVGGEVRAFGRAVAGARVEAVERRAKYLLMELSRGRDGAGVLVGHLRMTGRMHAEAPDWDPGTHVRVSLPLDDGTVFHFIDVRKFGRLRWAEEAEDLLPALGPEPLGPQFTAEWFVAELKRRRRALKPLLLDQAFVAGLGNIYVDESLHRAGLHPLRRADRVPAARARALHLEIRATLEEAIEREGSSFDVFYLNPEGRPGSFQDQFQVYGRDGRPCRTCGREVLKIVVAQRGTHLCSRCQPAPRAR